MIVFHRIFNYSKSPQISRTLLSILEDLNNAVFWMVSTCPVISKSFSPFTNPLVTVLRAPIIIGIYVTFMFISFFNFLVDWLRVGDPFVCQYYYYYYYFTPWEFFTSALADGFSLEFERRHVSSNLLDSSQYSGRSQQCCCLESLHPSRYFHVLQSQFQSFGDCTKSTNYIWYNCHIHVPIAGTSKSTILQVFSFLLMWSSGWDWVIRLYLKMPEEILCLILQDRFCVVHIPSFIMVKLQYLAQFPVDHLSHPVVPCIILFPCDFICIRQLCDWWFRLYPHITYICYSRFDMVGPYGVALCCN